METQFEKELFALKVGQSVTLYTKEISAGCKYDLDVIRVPTGWIFIHGRKNPQSVFVPITYYTNPSI